MVINQVASRARLALVELSCLPAISLLFACCKINKSKSIHINCKSTVAISLMDKPRKALYIIIFYLNTIVAHFSNFNLSAPIAILIDAFLHKTFTCIYPYDTHCLVFKISLISLPNIISQLSFSVVSCLNVKHKERYHFSFFNQYCILREVQYDVK